MGSFAFGRVACAARLSWVFLSPLEEQGPLKKRYRCRTRCWANGVQTFQLPFFCFFYKSVKNILSLFIFCRFKILFILLIISAEYSF